MQNSMFIAYVIFVFKFDDYKFRGQAKYSKKQTLKLHKLLKSLIMYLNTNLSRSKEVMKNQNKLSNYRLPCFDNDKMLSL